MVCYVYILNGRKLRFESSLEKYKTWEKSQEICNKYNASLVAIQSQQEQSILQTFLGQFNQHPQFGGLWYWTSGHRDSNGKLKWMNNGNEIVYTNWEGGQPNNSGNCIAIYGSNNSNYNRKWYDVDCNTNLNVVCEFPLNI